MLEHERIETADCGCHHDIITGIATFLCPHHEAQERDPWGHPPLSPEGGKHPESEHLDLLNGTATPVYRPEEGTDRA